MLSEWIAGSGHSVLWLFLDDGDNDPARFLAYLVAALRPLAADPEKGLLGFLRTPMPPSTEAVLTALVNGIADSPEPATLVPDLRFTRAESGVNLTAGAHALRIHLTTGGFNLNYLDVRAQTVPQQMLLNGTFSNGLTDWQTYFGAAGLATFVAEANSARIAIAYQGSNVYDIQIFQPVGLVAGKS